MGLRFRKSIKLGKLFKLNLSKSGVGVSTGIKGLRFGISPKGRKTFTAGIPGTGIYYQKTFGSGKKKSTGSKTEELKEKLRSKKEEPKSAAAPVKPGRTAAADAKRKELLKASEAEVREYREYIESLKGVHKQCEPPISWEEVKREPPPFVKGEVGPMQQAAMNELMEYKPTLAEQMMPEMEKEKREKLRDAVEAAKEEDLEAYFAWQSTRDIARRILEGDLDAYLEAIESGNPFEELTDFGSDFEFFAEEGNAIVVEFNVKGKELIPDREPFVDANGEVSARPLSKTAYYDIVHDYVASCSVRIAREIFSLLPADICLVNAEDTVLNTRTGHDEDCAILSVKFTREGFEKVNFERIDPSDFLESFEMKSGFNQTKGFAPIDRLEI